MSKLRIGFVLTGSFCTFAKVMPVIQALIERGDTVTPILSDSAGTLDTRFGTAAHWREELTALTGISPIDSIVSAEPIGPDVYKRQPVQRDLHRHRGPRRHGYLALQSAGSRRRARYCQLQ